jgi:integrase
MDVTKYIKSRDNNYHFYGVVNGKRIRQSLKTDNYADALLKAEQILGAKESVVPTSDQTLYIDAVDRYFMRKHNKPNAWRDGYKPSEYCNGTTILSALRRLYGVCDITYVSDVTFQALDTWLNDVKYNSYLTGSTTKKHTLTNKTLNKHVTRIKGFLEYCVLMGYTATNEAKKFEILPESTPDRTTFTDEQIIIILQNAGIYRDFFELMLETGLRGCDAMVLTKDNFPDGDKIRFESVKTKVKLFVPISKRAQEIVKSIKTKRLFPWATTKRQKSLSQIVLKKILGKAYCHKHHINTHTFRHTFAMAKYKKYKNMDIVSNFLGHEHLSTTKIYAKNLPNDVLKDYLD